MNRLVAGWVLAAVASAIGSLASAQGRPVACRLVALVDDRPITALDLAEWLRLRGMDPAKAARADWLRALNTRIDWAVLLEAGRSEKIKPTEQEVAAAVRERLEGPGAEPFQQQVKALGLDEKAVRQRTREALIIDRFLAVKLGAKLFVAPQAVARWYMENRDLLVRAEVRVARVITIRLPRVGGRAGIDLVASRKRAAVIRQQLGAGQDFARLAIQHSCDRWASKGGLLAPMVRGRSDKALADQVFALRVPGDLTPVFTTGQGAHVVRLEEVRPGGVPSFRDAQEQIRRRLGAELRLKHAAGLAARLRRRTTVQIFQQNLPGPSR